MGVQAGVAPARPGVGRRLGTKPTAAPNKETDVGEGGPGRGEVPAPREGPRRSRGAFFALDAIGSNWPP
jgi:hypothetical protein